MKKYVLKVFLLLLATLFIFATSSCMLLAGYSDNGYGYDQSENNKNDKAYEDKKECKKDIDSIWNDDFFKGSDDKKSQKKKDKAPYIKPSPIGRDNTDFDYTTSKKYIEEDILAEINLLRQKPQYYAEEILKKYIDSSKAANECYNELRRTKKMFPLDSADGLQKSAAWLVDYQGKTGEVGHITKVSGYEKPSDRISQFGLYYLGDCGENISYGYKTAREIVLQLLIDEGVSSREHRKNLLNPDFGKIGIAIGKHPRYAYVCVMHFANGYRSFN